MIHLPLCFLTSLPNKIDMTSFLNYSWLKLTKLTTHWQSWLCSLHREDDPSSVRLGITKAVEMIKWPLYYFFTSQSNQNKSNTFPQSQLTHSGTSWSWLLTKLSSTQTKLTVLELISQATINQARWIWDHQSNRWFTDLSAFHLSLQNKTSQTPFLSYNYISPELWK